MIDSAKKYLSRNKKITLKLPGVTIALFIFLALSGCKNTIISKTPENPKQGDRIVITIDNEERSKVDHVNFNIGGISGSTTSLPHTVVVDSCKNTGTYMTKLTASVMTTYSDGETESKTQTYNLTIGYLSTEDSDNSYSVFVAHDSDTYEDLMVDMANAFMNEFDSLSRSQYFWAEPRFYTSQCAHFANSADLVISFGHGSHHRYRGIDLSSTAYGNFQPCRQHGDAEYLVFASCQTLSMNNSGGNSWSHFWRNDHSSQLDLKPFSGLHIVMGFRTNFVITWFLGWSSGEDFLEEFASNLDSGDRVIDAWQEAVGDELDFDDGNRGTVFYLREYENDTITTQKDDYIYGNTKYQLLADYWD